MRLNTRLIVIMALFALLLLLLIGFVYQQSYDALKKRIIFDGNLMGTQITERLHRNFSFVEENIKLFVVATGLDTLEPQKQLAGGPSAKELQNYFLTFFQTEYGYRLFDDILITDDAGKVIVSTDGSSGNYADKEWWVSAMSQGMSYSFSQQHDGGGMVSLTIRILDTKGRPLGIIRANCTMSALVRGGGMEKTKMSARRIDLLTPAGKLLYSTALHRSFSEYNNADFLRKIRGGQNSFVETNQSGIKELIIVTPHFHGPHSSFPWILVLHLDYDELFRPVLKLRWWIGGGLGALLLMCILFFIMAKDITSRQEHEADLLSHQDLLQSILEGIEAAVIFIDKENFTITWANSISEQIVGAPLDQLIGGKCHEYICRYGAQFARDGCPAIGKKILHSEFKLHRKDGQITPVTKTVLELKIAGREHFVAILFDITKRKAIEQQLAHAQKLESVGSLAAGIAHEINTPSQYIADNLKFISNSFESLQSILTVCQEACTKPSSGQAPDQIVAMMKKTQESTDIAFLLEETPIAIQQSREGIERITSIIQAMKRFSHPGSDSMQLANINEALSNTSVVCRNVWKYNADMIYHLDEDLPLVKCLINDMNQVFLNLIINAAHAVIQKFADSDEKGEIILETRQEENDVVITISDNGIGIPKETIDRVFDPFFTTKEVGHGTGQGLALSYTIVVDKHEGSISIESTEGVGTHCTIRLPLVQNREM